MSFGQSPVLGRANHSDLPEVSRHEEKEHIPTHEEEKIPYAAQGYGDAEQYSPDKPHGERLLGRKSLLWILIISLVLIGALIGGLVGGLKSRNKNSSPKETSTASPDSTATSSTATNSPSISSSSSPTSASIAPQPSPSSSFNSSLASIAWGNSDGLRLRRLYYQDTHGKIKESAWNSSGGDWYASNEDLGDATAKSPIAAAVAGNTTWPFQISVYYLSPEGQLVEMYSTDGETWKEGATSSADIIPAPNSDLAAVWTQSDQGACDKCGGLQVLLFAYQQSNNKITVANTSETSPVLSTLDANPVPGTGLAFQQVWHSTGSPGLRLYYQDDGAEKLCTIDWETREFEGDNAWSWTPHEDRVIGSISPGAQIASFSWGTNATTGDPVFQGTLSSGLQGVETFGLGGEPVPEYDGWQHDNPAVMGKVQPYSSLAANADRHVYALEAGIVQEYVMSTDGTTWTQVGNVTIARG